MDEQSNTRSENVTRIAEEARRRGCTCPTLVGLFVVERLEDGSLQDIEHAVSYAESKWPELFDKRPLIPDTPLFALAYCSVGFLLGVVFANLFT